MTDAGGDCICLVASETPERFHGLLARQLAAPARVLDGRQWPRRWRTAWITGASTGIGRALAVALAERGVKVAASARSADKLAELARAHPGIAPLPLDVLDAAAMAEAVRSIASTLGPIDLAVLNAGTWEPMSSRNFSAAKAARSMAVNYQGIVNGIEALLPAMLERGAGHIALVASVAGYRGLSPLTAAYGPTKAAVINLAETPAQRLARARHYRQRHQPGLCRHADDQHQQVPDALPGLGRGRRPAHRARPGEAQVRDRLPLAAGRHDEARPPAAQPRLLLVRPHLPRPAAPEGGVRGKGVRPDP